MEKPLKVEFFEIIQTTSRPTRACVDKFSTNFYSNCKRKNLVLNICTKVVVLSFNQYICICNCVCVCICIFVVYVFVFVPQSSAHSTSWQVFAYLHMDQHVIMYGCREYVQYNVEYNCTQSYVWTPIYILLLRWALRNTDTRLPLLYIPHFMFQRCELKYFAFQKQVLVQNYESGLCAVNCLCWLWIATCVMSTSKLAYFEIATYAQWKLFALNFVQWGTIPLS